MGHPGFTWASRPAGKTGISTWEELLDPELLLDLWREFGPAPIWNYANRALPNVNRF
jgi:hypothetical protein